MLFCFRGRGVETSNGWGLLRVTVANIRWSAWSQSVILLQCCYSLHSKVTCSAMLWLWTSKAAYAPVVTSPDCSCPVRLWRVTHVCFHLLFEVHCVRWIAQSAARRPGCTALVQTWPSELLAPSTVFSERRRPSVCRLSVTFVHPT